MFGAVHHDEPKHDIFEKDPDTVSLRLSLIEEEVDELKNALIHHDMIETVDALADILYVTYGAGSALGLDLDKAFDLVHKSNMSKLCKSEQEAQETVEWYKKNEPRYDSPTYRKAVDESHWVVFNESTGKVLKSINYSPVDLRDVVNSPIATEPTNTQKTDVE